MTEKILAIYGSPRKDGNTDLLLQACIRGIRENGTTVHETALRDLTFSPCIECGGCDKTGVCVLEDDMNSLYPLLIESTTIILSAPVFFYGLNALAKAMVDRSQALWIRKYVLNKSPALERGTKGRGVLLSIGGSQGKKNFDGLLLTARYFFDAIDMEFSRHLEYRGIDRKGAVLDHPTACDDVYRLGKELAK